MTKAEIRSRRAAHYGVKTLRTTANKFRPGDSVTWSEGSNHKAGTVIRWLPSDSSNAERVEIKLPGGGTVTRLATKLSIATAPQTQQSHRSTMTKTEMQQWAANRNALATAEQRTRVAKMGPAERRVELLKHTRAIWELKASWRQRERDAAMIQHQREATHAAAERVIAELDHRNKVVATSALVVLAQRMAHQQLLNGQ